MRKNKRATRAVRFLVQSLTYDVALFKLREGTNKINTIHLHSIIYDYRIIYTVPIFSRFCKQFAITSSCAKFQLHRNY